jgi:hypothetical protein
MFKFHFGMSTWILCVFQISNLKKVIKTVNETDEVMAEGNSSTSDTRKKSAKKSLKASGKSWFKNFS